MNRRIKLQEVLESVDGVSVNTLTGRPSVYFQPPPSVKLVYPCIIYSLNDIRTVYADNSIYNNTKSYTVTVVDKDPDSAIPDAITKLPLCRFNRYFVSDNLHHWVFSLYF